MEYKIHSGEQIRICADNHIFARRRMNCLIRIRQRYAGFAQSDKKLADFLLSQPDHARHLSSQQLARSRREPVQRGEICPEDWL
jgi:hypothetical protein